MDGNIGFRMLLLEFGVPVSSHKILENVFLSLEPTLRKVQRIYRCTG